MAKLVDLVKITCNSTGTGAITLGAAVPGNRGIEVLSNGVVYSYAIQQGSNYEFGRATYLVSGHQLVRSPIDSSSGGVALDLQPNAQVALVALAEDFADLLGQTAIVQAVIDAGSGQIAAVIAEGTAQVSAVDNSGTQAIDVIAALSAPRSSDDSLSLAERRLLSMNYQGGTDPNLDGSFTVTTDFWHYIAITDEMRAAGKVVVNLHASVALSTNPATKFVQQQDSSNAAIGANVNLVAVGQNYQATITLANNAARLYVKGYAATANTTYWLSVTTGQPVTVPDATGEYASALIETTRQNDAVNLLGAPLVAVGQTAAPFTLNADGSVTYGAGSFARFAVPFGSNVASPALNDPVVFVVAVDEGQGRLTNMVATFATYIGVNNNDGGYSVGADIPINRRVAPSVYASDPVPANVFGRVPGVALVRAGNVAGAPTATVRFGLFAAEHVPAFRRVPVVIDAAIRNQIEASRLPVMPHGDAARIVTAFDGSQTITVAPESFDLAQAIDGRIMTLAALDKAVNTSGSDSAGGSIETPFATFDHALGATSAGDTIGLRNGQAHRYGRLSDPAATPARNVTGYGPAQTRARVDARQHLSGLTWTSVGNGAWDATGSFVAPFDFSNPVSIVVWNGDMLLTWKVGGADIPTNQAAVAAAENSFEIHKVGSSQQDILAEAPGWSNFAIRVHLSGGVSPASAGMDVSIADRPLSYAFSGGTTTTNVEIIGGYQKDQISAPRDGTGVAQLVGVSIPAAFGHACVGAVSTIDYNANGVATRYKDGYGIHPIDPFGRAYGGGLTNYSPNGSHAGVSLSHIRPRLTNFTSGIYLHGDGSQTMTPFFASMTVDDLVFDNVSGVIDIGGASVTVPGLAGPLVVRNPVARRVGTVAFSASAPTVLIDGGLTEFTAETHATQDLSHTLLLPILAGQTMTLRNHAFRSMSVNNAQCIVRNGVDASHAAPIVVLDNVRDWSTPANRVPFYLGGAGVDPALANRYNLVLQGGTWLWDLMFIADIDDPNLLPLSLTVIDNGAVPVRFGWGNRTRAQIRTYFGDHGVSLTLPDNTIIVGIDGQVLDRPA